MIYLRFFSLLDEIQEHNIVFFEEKRRIFNNYYPIGIFSFKQFKNIKFDTITIFYGGNGSGKSTLLNIIANTLNATKKNKLDKGNFFDIYSKKCDYEMNSQAPSDIKLITSDDIFDYLLDIRSINSNVNRRKEILSQEYLQTKFGDNTDSFDDYESLKKKYEINKNTLSKYVRKNLGNNTIIEQSNGESALTFWKKEIKENSIYILDEPENSLSAENQIKLKKYIEESARFYNCQFIISTHSPFLLNLYDAKIYNLDSSPVVEEKWTSLPNIKIYHDFFKEHDDEF